MSFRNFLIVSTSVFCLGIQPFGFNSLPANGAPTVQELISESKSALEGVRQSLSDFDSKLEFPMSQKEKTESQKQLNSFRAAFSISKSKPLSAKQINTKAQETLKTARQAAKEAESGDRTKALNLFTQSRIKLFEAKRYLADLELRGSSNSSTKLTGRAQKAGAIKNTRLVSQSPVAGTTSNTTKININPNGIQVDETKGYKRTRVDVSPSGINVNENGNRTAISVSPYNGNSQTPINISPSGVRVGAPGGPSAVNINPSGIQVGSSGQPGQSGINIGADGIRIGGLGQTVGDIVRGSVGAALSSAGIQSTGVNTNTVTIGGHDNVRTLRLNGQNLSITGHNNKITVIGTVGAVSVTGHDNTAKVDIVRMISVTGHDNQVFFRRGFNGSHPQLSTLGKRNQINRIQ